MHAYRSSDNLRTCELILLKENFDFPLFKTTNTTDHFTLKRKKFILELDSHKMWRKKELVQFWCEWNFNHFIIYQFISMLYQLNCTVNIENGKIKREKIYWEYAPVVMCMQRQINALRFVRMAHGQKKEKTKKSRWRRHCCRCRCLMDDRCELVMQFFKKHNYNRIIMASSSKSIQRLPDISIAPNTAGSWTNVCCLRYRSFVVPIFSFAPLYVQPGQSDVSIAINATFFSFLPIWSEICSLR